MSKEQLELNLGGASHVRFSPQEYRKVLKDSKEKNKTIPALLKDSYFGRLPEKVAFKDTHVNEIRKDLNRIGNNLNQIARKLNSGFMHGWHPIIDEAKKEFNRIKDAIQLGYNAL